MSGLIINADDLGYSPTVNRAIVDMFEAGLITSASLLVNQPASEEGAAIARSRPRLSVGVHLNLSRGRPILPAEQTPSLVDEEGRFWESAIFFRRAVLGQVKWHEAAAELEAQVRWALDRGLHLDNLDSHTHFHSLPAARRITENLATQFHVAAWRTPDVLSALTPIRVWSDVLATPIKPRRTGHLAAPNYLLSLHQWGDRLFSDKRVAKLLSKPGVVTELVVHPGYVDDDALPPGDQLQPLQRQVEVDLLTGAAFRYWLKQLDVQLVSFSDFRQVASG
ncbi:MAG: ChbG/HpnK family deacetylase [Anaerolineae bacterium]